MTFAIFHDFPGLETGLPKFHDFPWAGAHCVVVSTALDKQYVIDLNRH